MIGGEVSGAATAPTPAPWVVVGRGGFQYLFVFRKLTVFGLIEQFCIAVEKLIDGPRSSGYVIPMSVMADMLSANNMNNINVYDV